VSNITGMRTQTDARLAEAEVQHSHDPERAEVIARVRRFKAGWYELGESLTEIRKSERWRRWGYATFDDYCKKELHLKPDTVAKLTGSFVFLRAKAPEVLRRDGRDAPIPSYQAVDFLRRAEEESQAPAATVSEIRKMVLDDGVELPKVSRMYRQVVFPVDADELSEKRRGSIGQAIAKLVELLAQARADGSVPPALCAEVEEPLQRLAAHLGD
jgi:hypothetical protein